MGKWDIKTATYDTDKLAELLRKGYEPFAVSGEANPNYACIWLRKKLE